MNAKSLYPLYLLTIGVVLIACGPGTAQPVAVCAAEATARTAAVIPDGCHGHVPTTYYVATDGSDGNDGESAPFKTIQWAAGKVCPGDTVIVKDGVYFGPPFDPVDSSTAYLVNLNRGGTRDNWITFRSENRWGAILDGGAERYGWPEAKPYLWNFNDNAAYVRVEGFELRNGMNGFYNNSHHAHHIYIYGNHIHSLGRICAYTGGGQGIAVFQGVCTSHHTYDSNVIHDNGRFPHGENGCDYQANMEWYEKEWTKYDHGLYLCGSHTVVVNNIFYNLHAGRSISCGCYATGYKDEIINNVFAHANPDREGYILVHSYEAGNYCTIIENNIFYHPTGDAIITFTPRDSMASVTGLVVQNNLVFGGKDDGLFDEGRSGAEVPELIHAVVENNIEGQDPLFWDPDAYDFHLRCNSPAIDVGIADKAPDHDIEGNLRPQGSGHDIGAYEYADPIEGLLQAITDRRLPANDKDLLVSKIREVQGYISAGDTEAAVEWLEEMIDEIEARQGKTIPEPDARVLIEYAREIICWLGTPRFAE